METLWEYNHMIGTMYRYVQREMYKGVCRKVEI